MKFGQGILFIAILILVSISCGRSRQEAKKECVTYDCRRKKMEIHVQSEVVKMGETTTLIVKRNRFYLPHFRVLMGEYDEDFNLPEDVDGVNYFEGTDSTASAVLEFESSGMKTIRGVIEEYLFVTKDSIESYLYPFEVKVEVRDTVSIVKL